MSVNNRIHELLEFFKTNPPPEEVYERYYDEPGSFEGKAQEYNQMH